MTTKERTKQISIEAAFQAEGNTDYQAGFFDGARWADENPCITYTRYTGAEDFLKDNAVADPNKKKYFLLYCDDKIRVISLDSQGNCYPEVMFVSSHQEPIDISSMSITHYLQIAAIR